MKILFTCIYSHPSICGVWNRVYNLSKLLMNKGHQVYVFSTDVIKGNKKKSSEYENFEGIEIYRFKPFFSFGENVKFWNFYKKFNEINPDLVIAEVYRHPHTHHSLKVTKKLKKPIFLTTHAPFVAPELRSNLGNFIADFYDKYYGKKMLNNFDRIIAITKWEVPYLLNLGAEKNKIEYIPNGIPEEFFKIKRKKGDNLLFLGRICPIKNLEILITAMKETIKKYPKLHLNLVGPAEEKYKRRLINLIHKLNFEENISFYPAIYNIKEKIKIIDNSKIFILPSKREAMPQSLIEAMARGKIVIASKNIGTEEIISDGKNGFLFNVNDSKGLSSLIDYCLTIKDSKLDIIRKNAILKAGNFKWTEIFKDFENLIKKYEK